MGRLESFWHKALGRVCLRCQARLGLTRKEEFYLIFQRFLDIGFLDLVHDFDGPDVFD